jgi:hypothetical protein
MKKNKVFFPFKWAFIFFAVMLINQKSKAQQTIYIDTLAYSCAPDFNVFIRTKNINNIVALQGTIAWDTSVVTYKGLLTGTSSVQFDSTNMNLADTTNGRFTFLWYDNTLAGQIATNDSSLFGIKFTRNGIGKGKVAVSFTSNPTPVEIDTIGTNGIPNKNVSAVFSNGYIVTPSNYTFNGTGNWDNPSNWIGNNVPPTVLPQCSEIIVNPIITGMCTLNIPQTISSGATITVSAGKKFVLPNGLLIQ